MSMKISEYCIKMASLLIDKKNRFRSITVQLYSYRKDYILFKFRIFFPCEQKSRKYLGCCSFTAHYQ